MTILDDATTREDVIAAYRMLLGRDPESDAVIDRHLATHRTIRELRQPFMSSVEFTAELERLRMDLLLQHLRKLGLRCEGVMDVGANRADWSRMAKKIFPEARFTLIEPQVEMKPKLEEFCADYPDSSYLLAGAGKQRGELTLTIWDDLNGSSFLPKRDIQLLKTGKQRDVPIITINEVIASNSMPIPELIKLDIQGFELEALKGASVTFGRTIVYVIEVSLFSFSDVPGMPVFYEVVEFMQKKGYVVYDFAGFLRRPVDGALAQCDICFVPEHAFLRSSNSWN
jgi:FkbM family methyltransferase